MNKYKATKTLIDGIKFDSKLEGACYVIAKDYITELQPRFLLDPAFTVHGKKYRKIEYVADFVLNINSKEFIVDVKGMETPVFKLKKKMFLSRYPDKELVLIKNQKTMKAFLNAQVSC
jgi:hypothetical protein